MPLDAGNYAIIYTEFEVGDQPAISRASRKTRVRAAPAAGLTTFSFAAQPPPDGGGFCGGGVDWSGEFAGGVALESAGGGAAVSLGGGVAASPAPDDGVDGEVAVSLPPVGGVVSGFLHAASIAAAAHRGTRNFTFMKISRNGIGSPRTVLGVAGERQSVSRCHCPCRCPTARVRMS